VPATRGRRESRAAPDHRPRVARGPCPPRLGRPMRGDRPRGCLHPSTEAPGPPARNPERFQAEAPSTRLNSASTITNRPGTSDPSTSISQSASPSLVRPRCWDPPSTTSTSTHDVALIAPSAWPRRSPGGRPRGWRRRRSRPGR
jgi:hypothetical protein